MIKAKIKEDGSNELIFECSTEKEMIFLKEKAGTILDKFVQIKFDNIGKLSVKTWEDYIEFCKASPKEILEAHDGHAIPFSKFGEIETKVAFLLREKATKQLTTASLGDLSTLANNIFNEQNI